eukprot:m.73752 g.73752  ORF g.73752 m.73752 type:complete len:75 (+) comp50305_c0_seq4:775-999(+)
MEVSEGFCGLRKRSQYSHKKCFTQRVRCSAPKHTTNQNVTTHILGSKASQCGGKLQACADQGALGMYYIAGSSL